VTLVWSDRLGIASESANRQDILFSTVPSATALLDFYLFLERPKIVMFGTAGIDSAPYVVFFLFIRSKVQTSTSATCLLDPYVVLKYLKHGLTSPKFSDAGRHTHTLGLEVEP